ncbi:uncharacterized protein LOC128300513 [Anopheles moucheti]|uniref:uncharacterized protein LOC128300513 n=1 Tax=Anopheles moucheti TaxID=186751 RepID=UPI0022F09208|nr:uncharacterized protein LOC128300513 [Anopheles moucheti]
MATKEKKILQQLTRTYNDRASIIQGFVNFITKYDALVHSVEIETRLQGLEDAKLAFEVARDKLLVENDDCDSEQLRIDRELFYQQYYQVKGFLTNKMAEENITRLDTSVRFGGNSTLSQTLHGASRVRLPKMELPTFSGEITQWLTYKDRFTSMVHDVADLSDVLKLQYLLASLKGEAAQQFDHVQLIDGNYASTWKALTDRYDNSKVTRREYFKALVHLEPMTSDSVSELTRVVNEIKRLVRGMERLKEPITHWDTPLVALTMLKLDKQQLLEWERASADATEDKYKMMIEFLEKQTKMFNNVSSHSIRVITTKSASNTKSATSNNVSSSLPGKLSGKALGRISQPRGSQAVAMACTAEARGENMARCSLCSENHPLASCSKFEEMSLDERQRVIASDTLCFNCLKGNHRARFCRSRERCKICKGRHHVLMCRKPSESQLNSNSHGIHQEGRLTRGKEQVTMINAMARGDTKKSMVWLSTVQVLISNSWGVEVPVRALLDQGSQCNFISEAVAQQLRLKKRRVQRPLSGVGAAVFNVETLVSVDVKSRNSSYAACLECLVLPKVTARFPAQYIDIKWWKIPEDLPLADPGFNQPEKIDLLIGAEIFGELLQQGQLRLAPHLPMLLETKLGWIISGREVCKGSIESSVTLANCVLSEEKLNAAMEQLVMLENIPEERVQSSEEEAMEQWYLHTTTREKTGRYVVELPKIPQYEERLGDSMQGAVKRFASIERRLARDNRLKEQYSEFMEEYLRLGHMTEVSSAEKEHMEGSRYYLPHHAVLKQASTTTKCRVVFDASHKTSTGTSLNDILLNGPQLQDDIVSILLRFRMRRIGVVADVEKMYRQVLVSPTDRNLQCILWRKEGSENVSTFQLNTITYGTACAPYLAIRTLRKIFEDHEESHPKAMCWYNDFYVDDLLSGADTEEEVQQIRSQLVEMLGSAGFRIRKWASNAANALKDVPKEDLAVSEEVNIEGAGVGTLGLVWKPNLDVFSIRVPVIDTSKPITKRNVLSNLAKMYDPLGFLDPIKMKGKLLMQTLRTLKEPNGRTWSWDAELPEKIQSEYSVFSGKLNLLDGIVVPRYPKLGTNWQYHIFCDASERGYGACVYIRSGSVTKGFNISLIISKSKVAPLSKKLVIARLELCGALLASRLYQFIRNAQLQEAPCFIWTDSMTTWHWINGSPHTWKTFVANRVAKIQTLTKHCVWRHVPGLQNPADLVSRGCDPDDFCKNSLWWSGPEWLALNEENWPDPPETGASPEIVTIAIEEERAAASASTESSEKKNMFSEHLFKRISSYTTLCRVVAYCMRFGTAMKSKRKQLSTSLSTEEILNAEIRISRLAQVEVFSEEIRQLRKGDRVPGKSPLSTLATYLDDHGLVRVKGRLDNSSLSDWTKHPIVIPKTHQLSELLVQHYHRKLLHAAPQLTAIALRQRFWVLGARTTIRKVCRECVICFKAKPSSVVQPMAQLPAERVMKARPFSISGVDYCGPVFIKGSHRKAAPIKAFIAVFVCFVTKAVHLELVSNLSTEAFLAALRRFVARRGLVSEMQSDNGTNFKGAANELNALYKLLQSSQFQNSVQEWSSSSRITWRFIPPRAPHFGGLWEAAVRSMKLHLKRVLGDTSLTYEDMTTLLTEIEGCLNSRPITPMSDDPADLEALTPGHFLTGSNMQQLPNLDMKDVPENRLNHWRATQQRAQHFWNRWHKEYLQQLNARTKWNGIATELKPGMMEEELDELPGVSEWTGA